MTQDSSQASDELRRLSYEMRKVDTDLHEKNEQIEKLNRDLRKVNLQSFVRETNSTKVIMYQALAKFMESKMISIILGLKIND